MSGPDRGERSGGQQVLAVQVLLVLLLVGVGASVVLVTARDAGVVGVARNQADQQVPALQVNPAPVELGTVGQPVGVGLPAGSVLPGAGLAGAGQDGPVPASRGPATVGSSPGAMPVTGPAGGSLASLAAWAHRLAGTTDIPTRALQAYGLADLAMRRLDPGCHLSWVTVAGLARIESNHGRFRGSSVGPDGQVDPPIVGVPLDGSNGNTTILDGGDYAQAMGPLQFIPSTWMRWGVDTHGTGRADVNNIDDAAVAAGRYLCAAGHDLSTGPGWRAGVLVYNASDDYARRVYAAADAYAYGQAV